MGSGDPDIIWIGDHQNSQPSISPGVVPGNQSSLLSTHIRGSRRGSTAASRADDDEVQVVWEALQPNRPINQRQQARMTSSRGRYGIQSVGNSRQRRSVHHADSSNDVIILDEPPRGSIPVPNRTLAMSAISAQRTQSSTPVIAHRSYNSTAQALSAEIPEERREGNAVTTPSAETAKAQTAMVNAGTVTSGATQNSVPRPASLSPEPELRRSNTVTPLVFTGSRSAHRMPPSMPAESSVALSSAAKRRLSSPVPGGKYKRLSLSSDDEPTRENHNVIKKRCSYTPPPPRRTKSLFSDDYEERAPSPNAPKNETEEEREERYKRYNSVGSLRDGMYSYPFDYAPGFIPDWVKSYADEQHAKKVKAEKELQAQLNPTPPGRRSASPCCSKFLSSTRPVAQKRRLSAARKGPSWSDSDSEDAKKAKKLAKKRRSPSPVAKKAVAKRRPRSAALHKKPALKRKKLSSSSEESDAEEKEKKKKTFKKSSQCWKRQPSSSDSSESEAENRKKKKKIIKKRRPSPPVAKKRRSGAFSKKRFKKSSSSDGSESEEKHKKKKVWKKKLPSSSEESDSECSESEDNESEEDESEESGSAIMHSKKRRFRSTSSSDDSDGAQLPTNRRTNGPKSNNANKQSCTHRSRSVSTRPNSSNRSYARNEATSVVDTSSFQRSNCVLEFVSGSIPEARKCGVFASVRKPKYEHIDLKVHITRNEDREAATVYVSNDIVADTAYSTVLTRNAQNADDNDSVSDDAASNFDALSPASSHLTSSGDESRGNDLPGSSESDRQIEDGELLDESDEQEVEVGIEEDFSDEDEEVEEEEENEEENEEDCSFTDENYEDSTNSDDDDNSGSLNRQLDEHDGSSRASEGHGSGYGSEDSYNSEEDSDYQQPSNSSVDEYVEQITTDNTTRGPQVQVIEGPTNQADALSEQRLSRLDEAYYEYKRDPRRLRPNFILSPDFNINVIDHPLFRYKGHFDKRLCYFDLFGTCKDTKCKGIHRNDYFMDPVELVLFFIKDYKYLYGKSPTEINQLIVDTLRRHNGDAKLAIIKLLGRIPVDERRKAATAPFEVGKSGPHSSMNDYLVSAINASPCQVLTYDGIMKFPKPVFGFREHNPTSFYRN